MRRGPKYAGRDGRRDRATQAADLVYLTGGRLTMQPARGARLPRLQPCSATPSSSHSGDAGGVSFDWNQKFR